MAETPDKPTPADSHRLEEGLQKLRELGYLQTRAERYVARKVPRGAPLPKVAGLVGLWVGVPGGVVFAWILVFSAWLSRPELADSPRQLAWLTLDMSVALAGVGFLGASLGAAITLRWLRARGGSHRQLLTRVAAYAPGLLAGLYLSDRMGQHLLVSLSVQRWVGGAIAVVIIAGALASAMTWLQSAMFATARLQWKGVWDPPRIGWQERSLPFLVVAFSSALLLAVGPYREGQAPPRLDEVRAPAVVAGASLLIVGVDGVDPSVLPPGWGVAREIPLSPRESVSPPTVFWNEIATGFDPASNGLRGVSEVGARGMVAALPGRGEDPLLAVVLRRLLPGVGLAELRPTDRRELRRPQLWEIAAHGGLQALVINWWATYPAARHPRLEVVSDRYWLRSDSTGVDQSVDENVVAPFGLASQLEIESEQLGLLAEVPDSSSRGWNLESTGDRRHWNFALAASAASRRALVSVLLTGPDIARRSVDSNSAEVAAYRQALREMFSAAPAVDRPQVYVLASSLEDGPRRLWVLAREAPVFEEATRTPQLTPAALRHLGLAVGADMEPLIREEGTRVPADPEVDTWGLRPEWSPPAERPSSDLEKLRSLGYIGD